MNINKYFKKQKKLKPLIVAEISANHNGSKRRLLKLISAAANNGADLVKIQTYEPVDITINKDFKNNRIKFNPWKLYNKAQTPFKWHKDAFKLAKKLGIILFSTPFSTRAVDLLEKFNVKLYKISSFEITDFKLIERISKTKKPVIISTGMASIKEIKNCIKIISKYHKKILILHCVSGYPTGENESNLNRIKTLERKFKKYNIGLSDHTKDIITSLTSIPLGVVLIEKHFTVSKNIKSLDKEFSINPMQLKKLSKLVNKVFYSLGEGRFELQKSEKSSLRLRRSIFTTKNILKGDRLSNKNISTFRPKIGLGSEFYFKVIGKKIKRNLNKFEPIFKSDIT